MGLGAAATIAVTNAVIVFMIATTVSIAATIATVAVVVVEVSTLIRFILARTVLALVTVVGRGRAISRGDRQKSSLGIDGGVDVGMCFIK